MRIPDVRRPEPLNDACKLVRETVVIVKDAAERAVRDARKVFDTQPEPPQDERPR